VAVELAAVPVPDACEVAERHPTRGVPVAAGPSNGRGRNRGGEGGMGAFGWGMQVRFPTLILVQEMRKFEKGNSLECEGGVISKSVTFVQPPPLNSPRNALTS